MEVDSDSIEMVYVRGMALSDDLYQSTMKDGRASSLNIRVDYEGSERPTILEIKFEKINESVWITFIGYTRDGVKREQELQNFSLIKQTMRAFIKQVLALEMNCKIRIDPSFLDFPSYVFDLVNERDEDGDSELDGD